MFIVEPVHAGHISGICTAFDCVVRERRYFAETDSVAVESFSAWMNQNIVIGCPQYVVLMHGQIVGWCIVHRAEQKFLKHAGTLFMGLLPHVRGKGLGTSLLRATLDKAWSVQLTRIQLDVYADNEQAIKLYRKFGFQEEGIRRNAHFQEGCYRDVLSMGLLHETATASIQLESAEAA